MRPALVGILTSLLCVTLADATVAQPARARVHSPRPPPGQELPRHGAPAMGFQLDLFPTVISAVNGKPGYAPQVWFGVKPLRLRLIAAHLEPPDAFTLDDAVVDPKLTVLAATIDHTFGRHFDGAWLGAGTEAWLQRASAKDGSGEGSWTSAVFTLGGGYIWRFAGNFYLDPWFGVHVLLNPHDQNVGDTRYSPAPISVSASVKVGWFFWAR